MKTKIVVTIVLQEFDSASILLEILQDDAGLRAVRTESQRFATRDAFDLLLTAESQDGVPYKFAVEERQSLTPMAAKPLFHRMSILAPDFIPLVFCPVISLRITELAREAGISWCDSAGNCRIHQPSPPLLIVRQGRKVDHSDRLTVSDPFSPKSSRIVRALLSDPQRVWSVQELSDQEDVRVSLGLISKVRQSLIQGAFISAGARGTSVRDATALLTAWAGKYQGPLSKRKYFAIGEPDDIEHLLFEWCRRNGVTVTLSGFSAAWKSAPMVRAPIVTAYVNRSLASVTKQLTDETDIAQVDSGANLILWEPYDTSVFADRRFSEDALISWTSPIQTYLDLIQLKGRGQEAADEIYERLIKSSFDQPTAGKDLET